MRPYYHELIFYQKLDLSDFIPKPVSAEKLITTNPIKKCRLGTPKTVPKHLINTFSNLQLSRKGRPTKIFHPLDSVWLSSSSIGKRTFPWTVSQHQLSSSSRTSCKHLIPLGRVDGKLNCIAPQHGCRNFPKQILSISLGECFLGVTLSDKERFCFFDFYSEYISTVPLWIYNLDSVPIKCFTRLPLFRFLSILNS